VRPGAVPTPAIDREIRKIAAWGLVRVQRKDAPQSAFFFSCQLSDDETLSNLPPSLFGLRLLCFELPPETICNGNMPGRFKPLQKVLDLGRIAQRHVFVRVEQGGHQGGRDSLDRLVWEERLPFSLKLPHMI